MTIKQQGGIFGRNPTFNDVDVEGTLTVNGEPISDFGTMAQQDASSVDIDGGAVDGVSLGTNSPVTEAQVDNLNIDGNTISATNTNGGVTVSPNGTGVFNTPADFRLSGDEKFAYFRASGGIGSNDRGKIRAVYAGGGSGYGGDLRLSSRQQNNVWNEDALIVRYDGDVQLTGDLVLASGKGIDFSATSGTGTSELFDDYEEGTWTPVVTSSVGTITTVGTVQGFYTKIGNFVFVWGTVQVTDIGTGSGALLAGGLPFTCLGTTQSGSGCIGSGYNTSSAQISLVRITGNSTTAQIRRYDGAFPVGSGQTIGFSGNYYV